MSGFFPVSEGDAAAMHQRIQQIIEAWLSLEIGQEESQDLERGKQGEQSVVDPSTKDSEVMSVDNNGHVLTTNHQVEQNSNLQASESENLLAEIRQGLSASNYLAIASVIDELEPDPQRLLFDKLQNEEKLQLASLHDQSVKDWSCVVSQSLSTKDFSPITTYAANFPKSVQRQVYEGLSDEQRDNLLSLRRAYIEKIPSFEISSYISRGKQSPMGAGTPFVVAPQTVPPSAATPSITQETSAAVFPQSAQSSVGGIKRAFESVEQLPEGQLKTLLTSQMQQMTDMISALQTQVQHLTYQQQTQQALWYEVASQRSQYHNLDATAAAVFPGKERTESDSWLGRTVKTVGQTWDKLMQRNKNHCAAEALRTLYHARVAPGEREYHAEDYIITRQGRDYTLAYKSGENVLMKFCSTPMGV